MIPRILSRPVIRESTPTTGYAADLAALDARATAVSDAVAAAIHSVVPDPTAIRACGRVLGISKNLAWKMVHIAGAADLATVISASPGPRGWKLVVEALENARCDPGLVEHLRSAIARFDREIKDRDIDRRTLASMAGGGLDSAASREEQRRLREQATLANATVWGVLAEASISSYLVVPSGRDDLLDIESVSSLRGLHRLGPGPSVPIQVGTSAYRDNDPQRVTASMPDGEPDTLFDREHSTPGVESELVLEQGDSTGIVHFEGGGTSPTSPVDVVFTERLEEAGYAHARHPHEIGTFGSGVLVPSRWFVLETFVERSIPWHETPEAAAYSQIHGVPPRNHWSEVQRLQMTEATQSGLDADLPDELDSIRAAHHMVLADATERLGRSLADFTSHLVAVPWPVLASNLMLRWRLPQPKGATT